MHLVYPLIQQVLLNKWFQIILKAMHHFRTFCIQVLCSLSTQSSYHKILTIQSGGIGH